MLRDVLIEHFSAITLVDDIVVAKRVYCSCPIILPNKFNLVDLLEIYVLDFDVILGMDSFICLFCVH